jgi:hypothetical protein
MHQEKSGNPDDSAVRAGERICATATITQLFSDGERVRLLSLQKTKSPKNGKPCQEKVWLQLCCQNSTDCHRSPLPGRPRTLKGKFFFFAFDDQGPMLCFKKYFRQIFLRFDSQQS